MTVSRETLLEGVSRETLERLETYVTLLQVWNTRINLVGHGDTDHLWTRHVLDSLQLFRLFPNEPQSAVDLGSGAGFPGLVLAITCGLRFTLIEADARKAAFLREAARLTRTEVTILNARIENVRLPRTDLITARALAPLDTLLTLGTPLLETDGTMLFLKGAQVEKEIADAERRWTMRLERHISLTSEGGVILRISEVARA